MDYDKEKYKIWTWKNPLMLHWIINPGLVINELVLGQRVPKVSLIEKTKTKALAEKSWIPCPHCNTLHSGLKWSEQNKTAFKNWFGLYCDNCGKIIPCVTNLTSYILLGLTFPIWFWFKDKWKAKWLEKQKVKFSKPLDLTFIPSKGLYEGIGSGFLMYVLFILFLPIEWKEITLKVLLTGMLICCAVGGVVFSLMVKVINGKKKDK